MVELVEGALNEFRASFPVSYFVRMADKGWRIGFAIESLARLRNIRGVIDQMGRGSAPL